MEHVEITHHDGTKGKISMEEANRIHLMIQELERDTMREENEHYTMNAGRHIIRLAGQEWGDAKDLDEDTLKSILFQCMPFNKEQADLMYEIIERAIGMHSEKIFNA